MPPRAAIWKEAEGTRHPFGKAAWANQCTQVLFPVSALCQSVSGGDCQIKMCSAPAFLLWVADLRLLCEHGKFLQSGGIGGYRKEGGLGKSKSTVRDTDRCFMQPLQDADDLRTQIMLKWKLRKGKKTAKVGNLERNVSDDKET